MKIWFDSVGRGLGDTAPLLGLQPCPPKPLLRHAKTNLIKLSFNAPGGRGVHHPPIPAREGIFQKYLPVLRVTYSGPRPPPPPGTCPPFRVSKTPVPVVKNPPARRTAVSGCGKPPPARRAAGARPGWGGGSGGSGGRGPPAARRRRRHTLWAGVRPTGRCRRGGGQPPPSKPDLWSVLCGKGRSGGGGDPGWRRGSRRPKHRTKEIIVLKCHPWKCGKGWGWGVGRTAQATRGEAVACPKWSTLEL